MPVSIRGLVIYPKRPAPVVKAHAKFVRKDSAAKRESAIMRARVMRRLQGRGFTIRALANVWRISSRAVCQGLDLLKVAA